MHLKFTSTSIKGHGRGKEMGFPTVNLHIPPEFPQTVLPGIYAARVTVKGAQYKGALYYGDVPAFDEKEQTLEIYLIDVADIYIGPDETLTVEVVKYIRGVENFSSTDLLILQMKKDVEEIKKVLLVRS